MEGFSDGSWLDKPDKLATICPVRENGRWSRPTLRMKAFRRGQQDAEMCNMLVSAGVGKWYLGDEVKKKLGPISSLPQTFVDEATSVQVSLTSAHLESLRRAIRDLAEKLTTETQRHRE
jgi:hypothetical protein